MPKGKWGGKASAAGLGGKGWKEGPRRRQDSFGETWAPKDEAQPLWEPHEGTPSMSTEALSRILKGYFSERSIQRNERLLREFRKNGGRYASLKFLSTEYPFTNFSIKVLSGALADVPGVASTSNGMIFLTSASECSRASPTLESVSRDLGQAISGLSQRVACLESAQQAACQPPTVVYSDMSSTSVFGLHPHPPPVFHWGSLESEDHEGGSYHESVQGQSAPSCPDNEETEKASPPSQGTFARPLGPRPGAPRPVSAP